jgi:hypothetical protein
VRRSTALLPWLLLCGVHQQQQIQLLSSI